MPRTLHHELQRAGSMIRPGLDLPREPAPNEKGPGVTSRASFIER